MWLEHEGHVYQFSEGWRGRCCRGGGECNREGPVTGASTTLSLKGKQNVKGPQYSTAPLLEYDLDSGLVAGGWGQVVQCCLIGDGRGGEDTMRLELCKPLQAVALHRTAMAL